MALSVPRNTLPIIAAAVTAASTLIWESANAVGGLLALVMALVPLVVPALWGLAVIGTWSFRRVVAAVFGWLVIVLILAPGDVVLAFLAYIACGLGAGWAMGIGFRADRCLIVTMLPLIVILAWLLPQVPADQMIDDMQAEMSAVIEGGLITTPEDPDQQVTLAEYQRGIDTFGKAMKTIWPGAGILGLLSQAALILLAVRLLVRTFVSDVVLRGLPPFHRWEVPFYLVWILAAGLALVATRAGVAFKIGVNLILVSSVLLSIQGLAIQINIMGKLMPPWLRIIFWTVAGVFFPPLILASGVLLGLCDQWLDLRKLHEVPVSNDEEP